MEALHDMNCLGQRLLIVGDINTGKTTLCRRWLDVVCQQGLGEQTAVIDMAPHITEALALEKGVVGAGGYLRAAPESGVLDLRADLDPPRLSSKTETEAMAKAQRNADSINALFAKLRSDQRDILFINDVTLYLQAGSAQNLIDHIDAVGPSTLVVNGYWGERLGGGELTRREKTEMTTLQEWFAHTGRVLPLTLPYGRVQGTVHPHEEK